MSINNINNWFNFFAEKSRRDTKLKDEDLLAFGRRNRRFFNNYKPLAIRYGDLKKAFGSLADVEEAPIDSKQYARKDEGWEEVAPGLTPGSDIDVCNINMAPLVPNTLGTLEAFNLPGSPTDNNGDIVGPLVIVAGVFELSRDAYNYGPWFNSAQEVTTDYDNPADTEWNSVYTDIVLNGHGNIQDVAERDYGTFRDACNGQIGNNVIGTEFVCHVISTDQYFFFNVTSWDKGSQGPPFAGFVGDYQEVIVETPCEITFPDGSKLNKAPANTWDIANAAFVDQTNGNDTQGRVGDGNDKVFQTVAAAITASPTNFVIIKPGTISESIQITEDNVHIHCMDGVEFTAGGVTISGNLVQRFEFTGHAKFIGFSCRLLQFFNTVKTEVDFEFDYADNVATIVQNASAETNLVRMSANWALCHCFNGAGYAIRLWGDAEYHFNFKQYFHAQHTVAFARDGWTGKCTFTCPEIKTLANYDAFNYGNLANQVFGMDSTNGAYLEVNGHIYNDHPTYAFGGVNTVCAFYWSTQVANPSEIIINGDITVEAGIGISSEFLSLYGDFTLNGDLIAKNSRAIESNLTGLLGGPGDFSDQRFTFNGSIITSLETNSIGRGKYFYFKDCSILVTESNPAGLKDIFTIADNGGPDSPTNMYFYNCVMEAIEPTAETFNAFTVNYIVGTVNTYSNVLIGAGVTDIWTGFTTIPTLEAPKKS